MKWCGIITKGLICLYWVVKWPPMATGMEWVFPMTRSAAAAISSAISESSPLYFRIWSMALRSPGSFLELGDHVMADSIRGLGLSKRPLMTRYYVERGAILPLGEVVEEGVRPLEGYYGKDREGEHTVDYVGQGS